MRTLTEMMSLRGRVVLVTGGGGHIGRAVALFLAEAGAAVALHDRDEERCRAVAGEAAQAWGGETLALAGDMSDLEHVAGLPGQVAESLGRLDSLVNCAAYVGTSGLKGWVTRFEEQDPGLWDEVLRVNLSSVFALVQAAKGHLEAHGKGSVVNISSIYGHVGPDMGLYQGTAMGNPAAYAASKGGLNQLTRWLATVLGPSIRVNSVSPGGIARNQPEVFVERYCAKTPLSRMGTEEEVAAAVHFLVSDLSSYMTGQDLLVDGGWCAW